MLAKRIIPCLDVYRDKVVKGIQFRHHRVVGDILSLASTYSEQGADELVFYDITASSDERSVCCQWIEKVAAAIHIPFTVAGGIRSIETAKQILNAGADKLSLNSPALENPSLIDELSRIFGSQCVVIGIDSQWIEDDYYVYQYTGDERKSKNTKRRTVDWVKEVQQRGAGEIVLNCMQSDGVRKGYDIEQLSRIRELTSVPLVASGGAGKIEDFIQVFSKTRVDAALAASVFHEQIFTIQKLKQQLAVHQIEVRSCMN
ncbi:imidazole glycerol phosphate synthase subunit HisF [Legionella israelensis]|uniref:Imidazole glycerol phosphate synthase subunit HisF n=1 Tax=Legionella israelensis TaxID=454 RepID=A0A0W0WEP6_9GAMM|nr:imidazole glycerol phosphate synthase subunit HisF [Legionella israelensis]KTD30486.1 imidazole glycerol phosphate synthase subunit HisF [Legionella israelensis]QBS09138.1 imidazole glycerol phosphate synthase subunit HisF [Legionella israelensis]SCY24750.1 cyclase [Legionella israelensis DSM 19235]STX58868.1 imidazoleglycerol-phosphate synthase, cyclase subunit HisF [Legionella israelensis]